MFCFLPWGSKEAILKPLLSFPYQPGEQPHHHRLEGALPGPKICGRSLGRTTNRKKRKIEIAAILTGVAEDPKPQLGKVGVDHTDYYIPCTVCT